MSGVGLLGPGFLCFFDTDSSVSPTALGVQQDPCHRELANFMLDVYFESEAVSNRTMKGGPLVVHRAMRGVVVGTESGDVEVVGNGGLDVYEGGRWCSL